MLRTVRLSPNFLKKSSDFQIFAELWADFFGFERSPTGVSAPRDFKDKSSEVWTLQELALPPVIPSDYFKFQT